MQMANAVVLVLVTASAASASAATAGTAAPSTTGAAAKQGSADEAGQADKREEGRGQTGTDEAVNAKREEDKDQTKPKTVHFNHLTDDRDRAYELSVAHGEEFQVVIDDTCEEAFTYDVRGIYRAPDAPTGRAGVFGGTALGPKILPVRHDTQYGGYIVTIQAKGVPGVCVQQEKLANRTLVISVPTVDWDLSFTGGFTATNLTNPVYSLRPHPTDATKKQVQQDTAQRDTANLGVAAFVHLYHRRVPWLTGTFGLGIRESGKTEYLLGGGLRFSDKATLSVGVALGQVQRLPAGINTTDPVSDDNILNTLPTRTRAGWFVGITYSFINASNHLEKPFAGSTVAQSPPAAGGTAGQGDRERQDACANVTLKPATVELKGKGDTQTVHVDAPADCTVTVADPDGASWVRIDTTGAKGPQDITIVGLEDTKTAQTATAKIGAQTLTITLAPKPAQ